MGWDDRYIRKKREKVEVEKRMVGRGKITQCHIIRRGFRPYSEDRTFLYQYIFLQWMMTTLVILSWFCILNLFINCAANKIFVLSVQNPICNAGVSIYAFLRLLIPAFKSMLTWCTILLWQLFLISIVKTMLFSTCLISELIICQAL